jgi:Methylene-tetrahydrofolate reductase C terminal
MPEGPRTGDTYLVMTTPAHEQPNAPRPTRPKVSAQSMYALHHVLERNPLWAAVAGLIERTPPAYRAFTWAEHVVKARLFGCRMCGQCALPATAYACPMTCPKQLRNGPCGGVGVDGSCEVYPGMRCVWLQAYERAAAENRVSDMRRLQRPIDPRKWGQSSWVNYWQGRDDDLWADDFLAEDLPELSVAAPVKPPTKADSGSRQRELVHA